MKPVIIVSGKNGQLGYELEQLSGSYPDFVFKFYDKAELDITDELQLEELFVLHKPVAFINCAAYTMVDNAEDDKVNAYKINAEAVGNIANFCRIFNTVLFHFSTDYVFDGNGLAPYKTDHPCKPVNYYGYTKLMGEQLALKNHDECIIIRTSWVYSSHGKNFVKTMLSLMSQREQVSVVNDQTGAPTYAADLAEAVLQMLPVALNKNFKGFGIYHYSNSGAITWFNFAQRIKEIAGLKTIINPVTSAEFKTKANRPSYSVFDISQTEKTFNLKAKPWNESLKNCIQKLRENISLSS